MGFVISFDGDEKNTDCIGNMTGRCTGLTGVHSQSWNELLWMVLTELSLSVKTFSGRMD